MVGNGLAPPAEDDGVGKQHLLLRPPASTEDAPVAVVEAGEKTPDYSSVITQVTKREPVVPPPLIHTFNLQQPAGPGSPTPHRAAEGGASVGTTMGGSRGPGRGGAGGTSSSAAHGRGSLRGGGGLAGSGPSSSGGSGSSGPDSSWRSKFRCLLCCFAPDGSQHGGYVKSRDLQGVGGAGPSVPGAAGNGAPQQPYMMAASGSGRFLVGGAGVPNLPLSVRQRDHLIGPKRQEDARKKTLVLDLDETLVHSSFKPIPSPDYIIPVEIEGKLVDVYVLKRPWLDHFMESVGNRYEVVVFTASLSKYADPLLDLLDTGKVVRWRLFRDSCLPYEGNYVKDLAFLGRELHDVIIVDNSPHSYCFQPANALPIGTFIDNMEDQELLDLLPVLQQTEFSADVRVVLHEYARALGAQQQQHHQHQLTSAVSGTLGSFAGLLPPALGRPPPPLAML